LPECGRPEGRSDGCAFARHSRRMRHFGVKMAGKRAREPEPFVAPPRLSLRTPRPRLRRNGGGWVGGQMSVFRLAAGVTALAIGAAGVTALAAHPEGTPDLAPAHSAAD